MDFGIEFVETVNPILIGKGGKIDFETTLSTKCVGQRTKKRPNGALVNWSSEGLDH